MDIERLKQLLDSYGGDERHWPAELRAEMLLTLDAYPEARQYRLAARNLDLLLDSYQPDTGDLSQRIMDALPHTAFERLVAWLLPQAPGKWWRPALAGAMPFFLGLAIGLNDPVSAGLSGTDSSAWEAQERALLAPAAAGDWYE